MQSRNKQFSWKHNMHLAGVLAFKCTLTRNIYFRLQLTSSGEIFMRSALTHQMSRPFWMKHKTYCAYSLYMHHNVAKNVKYAVFLWLKAFNPFKGMLQFLLALLNLWVTHNSAGTVSLSMQKNKINWKKFDETQMIHIRHVIRRNGGGSSLNLSSLVGSPP